MDSSSRSIDIPYLDVCSWVFGNDSYDANKPIYIDSVDASSSISRSEAVSCVRRLISGFRERNLQPGDSVCMISFNNIYYSLLFLGILGAQGCFVGANPSYTVHELAHLLTLTKTRYVFVERALLQTVKAACETCAVPLANLFVLNEDDDDDQHERHQSWRVLLEHGEQPWYTIFSEHEAKHTPAALSCTSGTTGLPKVAVMSHHHYVAQSVQLADSGAKSYERFHLESYVAHIVRHGITETAVVTPIVLALLNLPPTKKEGLRTLRMVWAGGAPLSATDQNSLRELCHPDALFSQVWGLTEIGWITAIHHPERDEEGSVGRLLPGNRARIANELGESVVKGQGEIWVQGPSLMNGYLDNVVATEATVVGGWLRTGDIGYERNGKWYIVDRAKDLIKVRGWQVSPAELEQCLLLHPAISDAAVIGIDKGDGRGELPRAYIVSKLTDEAVRKFMDVRLSKYKALDGGIVRLDKVPRSAAGKILKPLLRDMARKELISSEETITENETVGKRENEASEDDGNVRVLKKQSICFIF